MTSIEDRMTVGGLDNGVISGRVHLLPGSAEAADQAPKSMVDQPYIAAIILDARRALYGYPAVQALTEPFAARYGEEGADLRAVYDGVRQNHAYFRAMVRQAIDTVSSKHPEVRLETTRSKAVRSAAAKAMLKLAADDLTPIIDVHGARVTTRRVQPEQLVVTLHGRAQLPHQLPGGVAAIQVTGSGQNSLMYRDGRYGYKLAFPFIVNSGVEIGEFLVYGKRDLKWYALTRGGYEDERYQRLMRTIGPAAVRALDEHYQRTIDSWK